MNTASHTTKEEKAHALQTEAQRLRTSLGQDQYWWLTKDINTTQLSMLRIVAPNRHNEDTTPAIRGIVNFTRAIRSMGEQPEPGVILLQMKSGTWINPGVITGQQTHLPINEPKRRKLKSREIFESLSTEYRDGMKNVLVTLALGWIRSARKVQNDPQNGDFMEFLKSSYKLSNLMVAIEGLQHPNEVNKYMTSIATSINTAQK